MGDSLMKVMASRQISIGQEGQVHHRADMLGLKWAYIQLLWSSFV